MKLYELCGADRNLRFSPYVWRTKMALAHKELDYESVPLRFGEISERLKESGSRSVPVVEHDGEWIADSWNIACYLEDRFPDAPSLFGGGVGRSAARFFGLWVDRALAPLLFRAVAVDIHRRLTDVDAEYFRKTREKRIGGTLESLVGHQAEYLAEFQHQLSPVHALLSEQDFVSGPSPAYSDYVLFGMFQWARLVSDAVITEVDSPISMWRERMLDLFDGLARGR